MGRNWNEEEDNLLRELIAQYGKQWSVIATHIPNRTATQIAARWEKCINPKLTKGPFNAEEDRLIIEFVEKHGCHAWPKITSVLPHRTPKQCRERWFNNLDPSVTKSPWTPEEDNMIFENYLKFGPKWSTIAHLIPGRTDNSIKNRWNASISKRVKVDSEGKQTLTPCKVRKYSKKNKLEQARPAALQIAQVPTLKITQDIKTQDLSDISLPQSSAMMSANSSPVPESPISFAPPPLIIPTPTFDLDPFGNDLASPFGISFQPFGMPTELCSPVGLKFGLQSPIFSPTGGSHVFDDL
ncbi:Myb-like DNA-binding domain containing protein [Tritrichomonas foetus]|uniref:Myb-like DNA-binding domain containing protein n=1 Tax=Tritrichomonas foetus TaxID=1144522 RepID=A0A1J4JQH1_9EUKA|nr:Myb-like DNA-binding domain containing protein [Tritrichomonas foetus]|eukprot:OHT01002.1 Myb-like DNA-binding domain containing protein [Tritrichomonas foetus]